MEIPVSESHLTTPSTSQVRGSRGLGATSILYRLDRTKRSPLPHLLLTSFKEKTNVGNTRVLLLLVDIKTGVIHLVRVVKVEHPQLLLVELQHLEEV